MYNICTYTKYINPREQEVSGFTLLFLLLLALYDVIQGGYPYISLGCGDVGPKIADAKVEGGVFWEVTQFPSGSTFKINKVLLN